MKIKLVIILCLTGISFVSFAQKFSISGYVSEKGSKETMIGATIYFPALKVGTTTNNYGFYSITLPKSDTPVDMTISYLGYTPVIQTMVMNKNYSMSFSLESTTQLREVVINGNKVNIARETQMSAVEIPVQQLKNIPALMGEKDIIKALQLLPGVQKGTEGSSGLYVRGGGPDQNLIILDDATVYNSNHLFGFFSTFNGDAIKNVQLIKGGFPARYGGRLSSVVDLTMKDGNQEKLHGEGGIGLIASRLTLEGPIKKGKSSFLISGRRTYLDIITYPLIKAVDPGLTSGYFFYDLNAKFNTRINDKNRLYISSYFGRDKFYLKYKDEDFTQKAGLLWGNITGTARWNHQFSNRLFANTSLIVSDYKFKVYSSAQEGNNEFNLEYYSGIKDYSIKYDLDFRPSPAHSIRTGVLSTFHVFTPSALVTKDTYSGVNQKKINTLQSLESSIYIEDDIRVNGRLNINPGLRFSYFIPGKNQYYSIEPRFGSRCMITEDLSFKASYAYMTQYLHLLSNSGPGLPTDLWVPATDKVKPQYSQQIAAGFARTFEDKGLEITLEGYYKKMDNIITYKEGASFFLNDPFQFQSNNAGASAYENQVTSGQGWSYGTELFIKYDREKFNGWIGYTLSWTKHQFDEVNLGKEYFPKYDRRHDLSLVGSYKFNEKTRLSATWVYGTGNAITLEQSSYPTLRFGSTTGGYSTYELNSYGDKNSFRMEAYHRLDIGLQRTKKKKHGERIWEFSVYNAYARSNPFFYLILEKYSAETNTSTNKLYKTSLFPLVPSVSYMFKF